MIPRDADRIKRPIALGDSAVEAILEGVQINPSRRSYGAAVFGAIKARLMPIHGRAR
jgi:hypothetical protein